MAAIIEPCCRCGCVEASSSLSSRSGIRSAQMSSVERLVTLRFLHGSFFSPLRQVASMQIWQSAASLSENANCIQFPAQNTETHSTPKGRAYHATRCLSDHLSVKKRVWPWGKPTSSPGIDQQRSSSPQTRRKPKIHFSSIAVSANSRSRWSAPWARTTADLLTLLQFI